MIGITTVTVRGGVNVSVLSKYASGGYYNGKSIQKIMGKDPNFMPFNISLEVIVALREVGAGCESCANHSAACENRNPCVFYTGKISN